MLIVAGRKQRVNEVVLDLPSLPSLATATAQTIIPPSRCNEISTFYPVSFFIFINRVGFSRKNPSSSPHLSFPSFFSSSSTPSHVRFSRRLIVSWTFYLLASHSELHLKGPWDPSPSQAAILLQLPPRQLLPPSSPSNAIVRSSTSQLSPLSPPSRPYRRSQHLLGVQSLCWSQLVDCC